MPVTYTFHLSTSNDSVNDLVSVKQEVEAAHGDDGRTGELTRHWVVCDGGELKEIKMEPSQCASETCACGDCRENADETHLCTTTNGSAVNETQTDVFIQFTYILHENNRHLDRCFESPVVIERHKSTKTTHLYDMWKNVHTDKQRESTRKNTHMSEGVPVYNLRNAILAFGRCQSARNTPHETQTFWVCVV